MRRRDQQSWARLQRLFPLRQAWRAERLETRITTRDGFVAQNPKEDSCRESNVVVGLPVQTHPAELQDQELADLQRSVEAAWLPDDLVRSGHGLGAAADRQAGPAAKV